MAGLHDGDGGGDGDEHDGDGRGDGDEHDGDGYEVSESRLDNI